jgi:putative addiction module CopG family antidote
MHISLTPELESKVKQKVASGFYNNASEVIRDALRFWEKNEELVEHMKLQLLKLKSGIILQRHGVSNKLKNIFKISRIRLMNLRPIRGLEDGGLKFLQDIIPFRHKNTSSSILTQVATLISLVFYTGKWMLIKI